jgi:hypothetical protein
MTRWREPGVTKWKRPRARAFSFRAFAVHEIDREVGVPRRTQYPDTFGAAEALSGRQRGGFRRPTGPGRPPEASLGPSGYL